MSTKRNAYSYPTGVNLKHKKLNLYSNEKLLSRLCTKCDSVIGNFNEYQNHKCVLVNALDYEEKT